MTEFDYSALVSNPPSSFRVEAADKEHLVLFHRSSKRRYTINKKGEYFMLWVRSSIVHNMNSHIDGDFVMKSDDLRRLLLGLGFISR